MANGSTVLAGHSEVISIVRDTQPGSSTRTEQLHPAWRAFVRLCEELRFGEIERVKVQDGVPVLAEVTRKKIKFT